MVGIVEMAVRGRGRTGGKGAVERKIRSERNQKL